MIDIRFEVDRIIFRNNDDDYTIASVKILEHPRSIQVPTAEPIIVGYFPSINPKDEFRAEGKWVDTGRNGYQFFISVSYLVFPETSKGMVEFLKRFVKGVGAVTAKRVVDAFKEDTFKVILNKPEKLTNVKGITKKKAEAMHMSISRHKGYEDVASFLIPLGLSYTDIVYIYDKLGVGAIDAIMENPYILHIFEKIPFKTIDKLGKKLKVDPRDRERIKSAIMFFIQDQMKNRGDMFVYKKDIINKLSSFLSRGAFGEVSLTNREVEMALGDLVISQKIDIEKDKNLEECIYITFYKYIEDEIVGMISDILESPNKNFNSEVINRYIDEYEQGIGFKLAKKQKDAIYMTLNNRLSILSGGPGTGKTQTINAVIYCLKKIKPNISIDLCAPTGRAAKRMTELTARKAKTIHRLIGLNSFKTDNAELNNIESDVLIIDEASMVDAYVFYKLLTTISKHTKVLIVGDYEQLPSVGAGLILRDLINSKVVPTTLLTKIFRQAQDSQIVMNSHKVINGVKTGDSNGLRFDKSKEDFYFIKNNSLNGISNLVLKSIDRLLKTGFSLDDVQVLSVVNQGDLGVVELNRKIQEVFNPSNRSLQEIEIGGHRYIREGDRVMQTRNNYDLGVFNGEVGNVVFINTNSIKSIDDFEILVDFGDREIGYSFKDIAELTLAYAITVHKSQGSEFPVVIMPFHSSLEVLLNRNIIYTAWTRAKERVVCIGDINELDRAIGRTDSTVRNSQIRDKIIDATN